MTDQPGDHPPPHPGLISQKPLIFTVKAGDVLYRHHRAEKDPIYFGTSGANRFDDPDCPRSHAFRSSLCRRRPAVLFHRVVWSDDRGTGCIRSVSRCRAMASLELTEDLRFIDLYSTGGLTRIGPMGGSLPALTRSRSNGQRRCVLTPRNPPASATRPSRPYPRAYAIYSRPVSSFKVGSLGSLMAPANRSLLNDILTLYKVELL